MEQRQDPVETALSAFQGPSLPRELDLQILRSALAAKTVETSAPKKLGRGELWPWLATAAAILIVGAIFYKPSQSKSSLKKGELWEVSPSENLAACRYMGRRDGKGWILIPEGDAWKEVELKGDDSLMRHKILKVTSEYVEIENPNRDRFFLFSGGKREIR